MCLFLCARGTDGIEAFVGVAEFLDQVGVSIALIVGSLCHFHGEDGKARFQLLDFLKGLHGHFQHRCRLLVFHFLWQVANAVLLGRTDTPF